jgi:hypothetical protein
MQHLAMRMFMLDNHGLDHIKRCPNGIIQSGLSRYMIVLNMLRQIELHMYTIKLNGHIQIDL